MAARRLHALSPKGRALVSDVLPEDYDYVKMTMRQLVFSLPEGARKRRSGGSGSGNKSFASSMSSSALESSVIHGSVCHPGRELPPCDLTALKKELSWAKLDKLRSGMKRFWGSLKQCCKRRVTYIGAREYHRCLMGCEDWDILMSIHLGYEDENFLAFDEDKDAYCVGEEFLTDEGVDDMVDSFKANVVRGREGRERGEEY